MILRGLTLAGGLVGAAATSQFPEYSQQYIQRLGGAVDALGVVVADFDASATAAGLNRDAALSQMQGTDFLERRRVDITNTIDRHADLQANLAALEGEGPFMRAYHLPKLTDPRIARAAWDVYQPALPLNFAGLSFAAVGLLLGMMFMGAGLRLLAWPFRRRSTSANAA